MVSDADFISFVDEELDAMTKMLESLGDDLANRALDVPGANSPYAILEHCLGVIEYWAGHIALGRPSARDRDAEFQAHGTVSGLIQRTREARARLRQDTVQTTPSAPPHGPLAPEDAALPLGRTQGGALLHIFQELARHRGQMDVTQDLLRAGAPTRPAGTSAADA